VATPAAAMLDFYPDKSPGRWAFGALWSWGESNPSAGVRVAPAQGLSSLARLRFRVSCSDRQ
jgi:hypothetical protein